MPLGECFRCEREFEKSRLIRTEGCLLCDACKELIEREYPKVMAEEFNHFESKCRGCE